MDGTGDNNLNLNLGLPSPDAEAEVIVQDVSVEDVLVEDVLEEEGAVGGEPANRNPNEGNAAEEDDLQSIYTDFAEGIHPCHVCAALMHLPGTIYLRHCIPECPGIVFPSGLLFSDISTIFMPNDFRPIMFYPADYYYPMDLPRDEATPDLFAAFNMPYSAPTLPQSSAYIPPGAVSSPEVFSPPNVYGSQSVFSRPNIFGPQAGLRPTNSPRQQQQFTFQPQYPNISPRRPLRSNYRFPFNRGYRRGRNFGPQRAFHFGEGEDKTNETNFPY